MAVKRTGQLGFVDALVADAVGGNMVLDRLDGLVKWYRFEKVMKHLRHDGPGEPGYPVLVLFKALLLQALYGLSERELEEALKDRISFRRFAGLSLEESVPDHTVLNRFRNVLVAEGLLSKLFAELDRQLEQAGVVLKRGTMLDATLIEAAAARPSDDRPSQDPDARFAKRQGRMGSTFGYKAHVGVDEGSGLIRSLVTTPGLSEISCEGHDDESEGDIAWHDENSRRFRTRFWISSWLGLMPRRHSTKTGFSTN